MRPEQIRQEIDQLELSEKLLLVEDIWDSIAAANAEIPLPDWHKQELDRRLKAYQQGELELHDWKSVHQVLRNKYK
ncbi:MAG: addiction module protein [gamma proteobacterium endosymbiont of Lamellibrachia anaximandri]|nr:addiction module protein [gamma proteobacterium endosymbiont of Lamellibrachia anaximandri]